VKEQPRVSYTVPCVGKLSSVNQLAAGGGWKWEECCDWTEGGACKTHCARQCKI